MPAILIVDGQRISRQHLVGLLAAHGNQTIEVGDGAEALEMIATAHPDLIISDVLMRMMDGYEFVKQLRVDPANRLMPVIFRVTPSYATEAKREALELGIEHVISKNAEPQVILDTVNSALAGKQPHGAIAKQSAQHLELLPASVPIDPNATVYIVDDDPQIRRLISTMMTSSHLKAESFASSEEFLDAYRGGGGCILTDIQMSGMSGIAMLTTLRARRMHIPAIIMTGQGELADAKVAMKLHVLDFLDKNIDRRTLLARVYTALEDDSNQRHLHAQVETYQKRMSLLTARERDLVKLLIEGRGSKEIAATLKISIKTVAIHRTHLMAKTGAANVADLVRISMMAGDL